MVAVKHLDSFSYFQRNPVSEFLSMFASTVAERIAPGSRKDIEEQSYTFHVYGRSEGLAAVVISDHDYPKLVAHKLLSQIVDEFLTANPRATWANAANPKFEMPQLNGYIQKYQDPKQADSILRIQQELDETKIVLHKTIESVLERGEKLDSLVERSNALSGTSRMFYAQVSWSTNRKGTSPRSSWVITGQETELVLRRYVIWEGASAVMPWFCGAFCLFCSVQFGCGFDTERCGDKR
jgi:synaptobrevin family protein YKT6